MRQQTQRIGESPLSNDFINRYLLAFEVCRPEEIEGHSCLSTQFILHHFQPLLTLKKKTAKHCSPFAKISNEAMETADNHIQSSNFTFKTESVNATQSPFRQKKDIENLIQEFLTDYQQHSSESFERNSHQSTKKPRVKEKTTLKQIDFDKKAIIEFNRKELIHKKQPINQIEFIDLKQSQKIGGGRHQCQSINLSKITVKQQKQSAQKTNNYFKKYEAKKEKKQDIHVRLSSPEKKKDDLAPPSNHKMPIKIEIEIPLQEDDIVLSDDDKTYSIQSMEEKKLIKQISSDIKSLINKIVDRKKK